MTESVVSSVAQYIGGQLIQEAKFLGGVEDQIKKIRDEMKWMQGFLKDADAIQDESEVARNWVSEIRELAYDVEDALATYILKAKNASFLNPKKYIRLHQIGNEIGMLQSKIQEINHSAETYGFKTTGQGEGTSSTTETRQQLRQSYPHYDDDVIGMEDNMKLLVAELINKKGPRLVSIAGMGGLGKTTLAKKVYNHGDVKHHFDCRSWSFISQQFQRKTILQEIIRKVGNQNEVTGHEALNNGELTEKLYKLLEDKCYLVVLDDIWSTGAWDVLKYAFPNNRKGGKIMLTTRNKKVAFHVDSLGFLHEPACLTEEESWELFCKKAFFWRNVASTSSSSSSLYPPSREVEKMEKLGKDMIEKCGGLPLAVVVLGGLLAMKQSIREWEMVAKDIGKHLKGPQQEQEQHGVSWILSLSYQDLPFYLKPCYLYLGLYPEDTEFHKRELIQMWIAEGFVQKLDGQGATMEEIGEEYLLELINRSMVQVSKRSFRGKVKTCRLHDLMRDLCLQKGKEENLLCTSDGRSSTTGNSSSSTSEVESISKGQMHRYAIHFTNERHVISMQQLPTSSPHLRALFLFSPTEGVKSIATLKSVCIEFRFLKVLVLENMGGEIGSLPKAIGKLIHLRYLRLIGRHGIFEVPENIGNLQSLQFLTLEGVYVLPNVLWKMEQLKYCSVIASHWYNNDAKQVQVDRSKNLTSLELSVWGIEKLKLGENLRKLGLYWLDGSDCKSLQRLLISRADRLQCLSLDFGFGPVLSDDYDWSPLSRCRSLWKLHLRGSGGLERIPKKWEEFLPNLTKLSLMAGWLEEDPIPILEMLPNLETLTLEAYSPLDRGGAKKYYFSSKGFGRLQYLRLRKLNSLLELEVEKGALPCLVHLQIRGCRYLTMLPEGLKFITSLKKLEVIDMLGEFNRRLGQDGNDWHKIQHIPSISIQ